MSKSRSSAKRALGRAGTVGLVTALGVFGTAGIAAAATTQVAGTGKMTGAVKGNLTIKSGSTYNANKGNVSFSGTLKLKKAKITNVKLSGTKLTGKIGKKTLHWGTVSGSLGTFYLFGVPNKTVNLTKGGKKALKYKKKAAGKLTVSGEAVREVVGGESVLTPNAQLMACFGTYNTDPTGGPFEALAGASSLTSNATFIGTFAACNGLSNEAATAALTGQLSTPIRLVGGCTNGTPGATGPNAVPNEQYDSGLTEPAPGPGTDCGSATGSPNQPATFPMDTLASGDQEGTLVGKKLDKATHSDAGLGLQVALGDNAGGTPTYAQVLVGGGGSDITGFGLDGAVLREPEINTSSSGASTVKMGTTSARIPIAGLEGFTADVVCDQTPNGNGNYDCEASAQLALTALAASALGDAFGVNLPAGTALGEFVVNFEVKN